MESAEEEEREYEAEDEEESLDAEEEAASASSASSPIKSSTLSTSPAAAEWKTVRLNGGNGGKREYRGLLLQ